MDLDCRASGKKGVSSMSFLLDCCCCGVCLTLSRLPQWQSMAGCSAVETAAALTIIDPNPHKRGPMIPTLVTQPRKKKSSKNKHRTDDISIHPGVEPGTS